MRKRINQFEIIWNLRRRGRGGKIFISCLLKCKQSGIFHIFDVLFDWFEHFRWWGWTKVEMVARHSAVMAVLAAMVLPATTGNNSPASGEYETIISEITGFTQVKHFYVHFAEKTTSIKQERLKLHISTTKKCF